MKKTVFSPADILLPPYSPADERWNKYAVIACDQFTSEPEYWQKAEDIVKEELSALGLVLPEAYLETDREEEQKNVVRRNMKSVAERLALHENCLVYVERTLPGGALRRGIVGKLDLCEYDFSPDSHSAVRATEQTVVERIPPRVSVRREAQIELPHVMIFANDRERRLIEPLTLLKNGMPLLYDFPLMLGGGQIRGYKIEGELLCRVMEAVSEYESGVKDGLVYAMGDGNHSLASAKAHFEELRAVLGEEKAMTHPARYALVEMVNLFEDSIEFEPIYRILTGEGALGFADHLARLSEPEDDGGQQVTVVLGEKAVSVKLSARHALTVGSLQILIDEYINNNPKTKCDYIHGLDSLSALCKEEGSVGFVFPGVQKEDLFAYVAENGTLPRKTFSMGTAEEKRYYIEGRKIAE